jgi:membrane-bound inhibitor of C-type lysozyme
LRPPSVILAWTSAKALPRRSVQVYQCKERSLTKTFDPGYELMYLFKKDKDMVLPEGRSNGIFINTRLY